MRLYFSTGHRFSDLDPGQADLPCHSPLDIRFPHCFHHKRGRALLCPYRHRLMKLLCAGSRGQEQPGCSSEIWLPLCQFSLSLSPSLSLSFSGWIPMWNTKARHVYLFAWGSKTHARGSPRWGTLHYSSRGLWPYIDGVSPLSRGFIGFLCKPRNTASFSPLFYLLSLTTLFFPSYL